MFTLSDVGTYIERIERQSIEWANYLAIELAIEYGYEVDEQSYELYVALLRANTIDDEAFEWFVWTAADAVEYLQESTYPGLVWDWFESEFALLPDFEYGTAQVVGPWYKTDVTEMYGVSFEVFAAYLWDKGYDVRNDADLTFEVYQV